MYWSVNVTQGIFKSIQDSQVQIGIMKWKGRQVFQKQKISCLTRKFWLNIVEKMYQYCKIGK